MPLSVRTNTISRRDVTHPISSLFHLAALLIASPLQKPTQHIRRSPRFAKANAHEKRDELRKIFTFLNKQKKETLPGIVKSWGKKTGGTKQVLVYRLYRFLSVVQERNRDPIDKLDQNEQCPSFSAFEKHHKKCEEIWQVPHDDAELDTVLVSVEMSEEVGDCSSGASILPGGMQNTCILTVKGSARTFTAFVLLSNRIAYRSTRTLRIVDVHVQIT